MSESRAVQLRTGIGFDVHPLRIGRALFLGGVEIPHSEGLEGHSDADVLTHAICDALLGAAGLEDIGHQFPDTDPQYKDIRSTRLLERVVEMLAEVGAHPVNVDCVIVAQEPKLSPHFPAMKDALSAALGLPKPCIGVKASKPELLASLGYEQGISAMATCLIETGGQCRDR